MVRPRSPRVHQLNIRVSDAELAVVDYVREEGAYRTLPDAIRALIARVARARQPEVVTPTAEEATPHGEAHPSAPSNPD